jgi:hypothetical protein
MSIDHKLDGFLNKDFGVSLFAYSNIEFSVGSVSASK